MIEESFDVGGDRLPLVRSAVIPAQFHHGFTTRRGGVSAPPFDSLNLGMKWGDARAHVIENRRRLQVATGVERIFVARQVHGANVLQVSGGDVPADVGQIEADGLFSDAPIAYRKQNGGDYPDRHTLALDVAPGLTGIPAHVAAAPR